MKKTIGSLLIATIIATTSGFSSEQVRGLKARHNEGQTFLTWQEVDPPDIPADVKPETVRGMKKKAAQEKKILYRIYRSTKPIGSLDGLKPIAQVTNLTAWNSDFYGLYANKRMKGKDRVFRYVIEDGKEELPPGTGLYVHNPKHAEGEDKAAPMKGYYAVTLVKGGNEEKTLGEGNCLKRPLDETEGRGVPVLQRTEKPEKFNYVVGATVDYYTRWESPPNASVEGEPFDYLVAVPKNVQDPAPAGIHFHCWGNHLRGGFGSWINAGKGTILIAPNQKPYDWWTGYHEMFKPNWGYRMAKPKEKDKYTKGVVRPYTQNRVFSFLEWATPKYKIDRKRVFTNGNSMGGSGSPMFAIRKYEHIAWCASQVGVHVPHLSSHFRGSYERVWGRHAFDVKFEDGNSVWDYFNDAWYMRKFPDREIGFLALVNGKDDGAIGWKQAIETYRALQETRRPHLFSWRMDGHGSRVLLPRVNGGKKARGMPIDIRLDQSLPAFTKCSLDNDPGTGKKLDTPKDYKHRSGKIKKDKFDGDSVGQVNGFLFWETRDIVDEADRWEMTVAINAGAPRDDCTVNLTPRRCQKFKPAEGTVFKWTNSSGGKEVQSGEVKADKWGLLTIEKLTVSKGKNRIVISK